MTFGFNPEIFRAQEEGEEVTSPEVTTEETPSTPETAPEETPTETPEVAPSEEEVSEEGGVQEESVEGGEGETV